MSHPITERERGAIQLLRGSWRDDGAEGESVHLVCNALEAMGAQHARDQAEIAELRAALGEACDGCGAHRRVAEAGQSGGNVTINKKKSPWSANARVWCVSFKVVQP